MGYEHRKDAVGGGGSRQWQMHTNTHTRTHTHSVPRNLQGGRSLGQRSEAILTHVSVAPPLIKPMSYERRENAVEGGESREWQTHTNTHTHTHIYSVPCDTQDG